MEAYEVLNAIIGKKGYKKYLEIGIDNPDNVFNKIIAENKTGVDPYMDGDYIGHHLWNTENVETFKANIQGKFNEMTSDEFFKKQKAAKFDLIFIDGLHIEQQVDNDIFNSLKKLSEGGLIVCHDSIPHNAAEATSAPDPGQPWCGEVYRSIWKLRQHNTDIEIMTWDFNTGFTFLRPGINTPYVDRNFPNLQMSFQYLEMYKTRLMNCMGWEQIIEKI